MNGELSGGQWWHLGVRIGNNRVCKRRSPKSKPVLLDFILRCNKFHLLVNLNYHLGPSEKLSQSAMGANHPYQKNKKNCLNWSRLP